VLNSLPDKSRQVTKRACSVNSPLEHRTPLPTKVLDFPVLRALASLRSFADGESASEWDTATTALNCHFDLGNIILFSRKDSPVLFDRRFKRPQRFQLRLLFLNRDLHESIIATIARPAMSD
jgi:hypothetical protein